MRARGEKSILDENKDELRVSISASAADYIWVNRKPVSCEPRCCIRIVLRKFSLNFYMRAGFGYHRRYLRN